MSPFPQNLIVKQAVLSALVIQTVSLILLMRATRTGQTNASMYYPSTSVFLMEAMKLVICVLIVHYQNNSSILRTTKYIRDEVLDQPLELLKLSVPSLLYVIQNNLLYSALSNLEPPLYQVCYQVKILTTAIFSVLMLKRSLTNLKWGALVVLTFGVALAQLSGVGGGDGGDGGDNKHAHQSKAKGICAVLLAACTSGFAGVYFEKMLKGGTATLWVRNIQMGIPSVLVSIVSVILKDWGKIASNGFFHGYDWRTFLVIVIQGLGGLIVAVVVKYADNILKTFAASFSIVLGSILSSIFFGFRPNFLFVVGAFFVCVSIFMFSRPDGREKSLLPSTSTTSR